MIKTDINLIVDKSEEIIRQGEILSSIIELHYIKNMLSYIKMCYINKLTIKFVYLIRCILEYTICSLDLIIFLHSLLLYS